MAKRKLSDSQRRALREDIWSKMIAGVPRNELVKSLSSKYKISPISMRWYLRTQPPVPAARSTGSAQGPAPEAVGAPQAGIPFGKEAGGGQDVSLLSVLNGLTERKIKSLMEAKRLIPKLQVFRRHELELRGRIRELEKKLESEVGKARGMEAQIKRLAGL